MSNISVIFVDGGTLMCAGWVFFVFVFFLFCDSLCFTKPLIKENHFFCCRFHVFLTFLSLCSFLQEADRGKSCQMKVKVNLTSEDMCWLKSHSERCIFLEELTFLMSHPENIAMKTTVSHSERKNNKRLFFCILLSFSPEVAFTGKCYFCSKT